MKQSDWFILADAAFLFLQVQTWVLNLDIRSVCSMSLSYPLVRDLFV